MSSPRVHWLAVLLWTLLSLAAAPEALAHPKTSKGQKKVTQSSLTKKRSESSRTKSTQKEGSLSRQTRRRVSEAKLSFVKSLLTQSNKETISNLGHNGNFPSSKRVTIDVGGEGRHWGAINLNPMNTTSTTGTPFRPIPNLVTGVGEKMPFRNKVADALIMEGAPIRPGTIAEFARVIKPGGKITLLHPKEYAESKHAEMIAAIPGTATQTTKGFLTTTVIHVAK